MTDSPKLTTPADRIRAAMGAAGIESSSELARRSGLKEVTVRSYANGTRALQPGAASKLARALNVEPSWLMFGPSRKTDLLKSEIPVRNFHHVAASSTPDFQHKVEVKGTAQGGSDGRFYFNGETAELIARPPGLTHRMSVYGIRLEGNSMYPAHEDGDLLFIDSARKPWGGRDALIELYPEQDGEPAPAFIKRVVKLNSEFVELLEFEPKRRTFKIQRANIKNLHLVLKNTEMY